MAAQHIINTFLPTPSSIFVSSQEYYALYIELHARIVDSYISIRGGENGELLRLQAQYFDQLAGDEHSEHLGVLIRNTLDAMKELGTTLIQNFRDTLAHKPHLLHMLDAFLMNITPHVQTIIQNLVQVLVNFEQYHIDFEQSEWIVYRKDYRIIVGILPENFASLVLDKPVTQLELTPIAQQKFKEGLSNPLLYARPEANHHTITNELAIAEQVLEDSAPQSTPADESLNSEPIQQTGT
jgi:hypothetical protein